MIATRAQRHDSKRKTAEAQLAAMPLPPASEAGWVQDARAHARTRLLDAGAPARRDEYWKYTDPSPFVAPMALVPETGDQTALGTLPFAQSAPQIAPLLVHFANGRLRPDLAPLPGDEADGVDMTIAPLAQALAVENSPFGEIFGVLEEAGQEKAPRPLAILNTATATQGLAVSIAGKPAKPLHIHHDRIGEEGTSMLRHLVRLEPGAEMTLLETGCNGNTVIEADIGPDAVLHHIRLQPGGCAPESTHIFTRLGENASFKSFTLSLGGDLIRNETIADLCAPGARCHIAGAALLGDRAHVDNTVFITHGAPDCESRQVFKNVLADHAHAVFQGKIFVRQNGQKTDGYQISQAVLLDEAAEFFAKPELEIYADDVICSHGSTTGGLDATALFYLRSRGVTRAQAEAMLVMAFAEEAVLEIEDPALQELIRPEIVRWMQGRA